jgi:hypothetical protein
VFVFPPDSILFEEEATKIGKTLWVRALQGWVAVHVVCGGFSKTQLFADTPEGDGATMTMLEEFDESCIRVERAYMNCPPESLKSMDDMKDLIFQQEFARQLVRELPAGHHDVIKQTWEEMQKKSKIKLNAVLSGAKGGGGGGGGGAGGPRRLSQKMNDDDSGGEED